MSLYDPLRNPTVDPADAIVVVHRFLARCRDWAIEQEIDKRLARVAETHDPAEAAKLHAWIAYQQFMEHALAELEDGTLDGWFEVGS